MPSPYQRRQVAKRRSELEARAHHMRHQQHHQSSASGASCAAAAWASLSADKSSAVATSPTSLHPKRASWSRSMASCTKQVLVSIDCEMSISHGQATASCAFRLSSSAGIRAPRWRS
jgi:hypothetical protein